MTEYDYSPDALEKYKAKQASVGRWAADTSSQASSYSHPFPGYTGTAASSQRPKPSRSSTLPTHVSSSHSHASSHSASTVRPSSGTVVSSASKRSQTMMMPSTTSRSSASRSMAPSSHHSSHHGTTVVSSSSRTSGTSHRSRSMSRSGSHASSSHTSSHHSSRAPSLSARSPTYVSGMGVPTVAPSDSISQAGSRHTKRSATLPPSQVGSGHRSTVSQGGQTYLYGPPDSSTTRPFTAHGHTIIPAPGSRLDIYYV